MLVLSDARRTVRARTPERHAEVRRWWKIARARLDVAQRLDPRTETLAALPLYRDGLVALAGAAVASAEGSVPPDDVAGVDAALAALERVWSKLAIAAPFSGYRRAAETLATPLAVDAAAPADARDAIASIDDLARRVERAIEPRSLRALEARRAAVLAVPVIAAVVAVATFVPPLFAPKDLALHKPVKISSSHPDSLAPPTGEWLVNGRIERVYGVATKNEDNPWMLIDLQKPEPVRRIVIYNRGDGWFTDCLPLEVLVGLDESSLHRVAMRETVFTQLRPWGVRTNETVRFVKLVAHKHAACALSEVEVYSR
jgi:hypothetical protein